MGSKNRIFSALQYNREDGHSAIPVAITRLEDLIRPLNPLDTLEQGFFHFEYRRWSELAIREALMNAFCHRDYRQAGPVIIRIHGERLSFENLGGFVGGVRPGNILHHTPVTRNATLVAALVTLRLINRANLGVRRMFTEFLAEGKPAPIISDAGNAVHVKFDGSGFSPVFRLFVAEESRQGHSMALDELLTLNYLIHHAEADTATLAALCQKAEPDARDGLSAMEQRQYIERGGTGRGTYWRLSHGLHAKLANPVSSVSRQRIDWETAKTRILSVARQRRQHGEKGLSNAEVRAITQYDRSQVKRLLSQLADEGVMELQKRGRWSEWTAK